MQFTIVGLEVILFFLLFVSYLNCKTTNDSALCSHPLPTSMDNWTHGAALQNYVLKFGLSFGFKFNLKPNCIASWLQYIN